MHRQRTERCVGLVGGQPEQVPLRRPRAGAEHGDVRPAVRGHRGGRSAQRNTARCGRGFGGVSALRRRERDEPGAVSGKIQYAAASDEPEHHADVCVYQLRCVHHLPVPQRHPPAVRPGGVRGRCRGLCGGRAQQRGRLQDIGNFAGVHAGIAGTAGAVPREAVRMAAGRIGQRRPQRDGVFGAAGCV